MRITSRRKAIFFFASLGVCLAVVAATVGFGWIILNWREGVKVLLGLIFFGAISTGLILNTLFLIREIRRNEQHDSFINAVTHELKTPIASIRLYLQTLQRRELEEQQRRDFYSLMLLDTDRLLTTVEQVLKAGESGHRRKTLQATDLDFGSLVQECVDVANVRHHLQPGAMRFQNSANGTATVKGDPDDLRTAVSNLLDNAVKYSKNNIDITVRLEPSGTRRLLLEVQDQGIGIPPHELKRVFKRFYRVQNWAFRNVKGTGLGLFIVRAIAKKHGGKVIAFSEGEGKGTTVTLDLPRSTAS